MSLGPDLQISYYNLTIILQQCQIYRRLTTDVQFTKHLTKEGRLFLGTIHLHNHEII